MNTEMTGTKVQHPLNSSNNTGTGAVWRRYAMWICCAAMVLPLGAYLFMGGTIGGAFRTLGLLAPLVICMGAHALMHRFTGHSCHSAHGGEQQTDELKQSASLDVRKNNFLGRLPTSAE